MHISKQTSLVFSAHCVCRSEQGLVIWTGMLLYKPSSTCCGLSFCHFQAYCLLASFTPVNRILLGWVTAVHHCVWVFGGSFAFEQKCTRLPYVFGSWKRVKCSPSLTCVCSGLKLFSVITVRHFQRQQLLCKSQQCSIDPFRSKQESTLSKWAFHRWLLLWCYTLAGSKI